MTKSGGARLGIALGGGAARGWAHIGVLAALAENGIEPDIVCGTSIGALVGGIYAAGGLRGLEAWVAGLTRRDVVALLDVGVGRGGALGGRKLVELYRRVAGDIAIEDLTRRFVAVATDIDTGAEVWLQQGPLIDAIRASISLPGVFAPVLADGRWLVDGGLVNPVPVTPCRALGAEIVIAVDLHGDAARPEHAVHAPLPPVVVRADGQAASPARRRRGRRDVAGPTPAPAPPSARAVIMASLDIMQVGLCRSRLAADRPDLLLSPSVGDVVRLDFVGGQATIAQGYEVVRRTLPAIRELLLTVER